MPNFLPQQYRETGTYPINHNYLLPQFADYPVIFEKLAGLIERGDYTLGSAVDEFEQRIAGLLGARHCVGVNSGTDAIFLGLKAAGIGPGDEVITTPFTFFATVGAIVATGARPVFADIGPDYNLDPAAVQARLTERTRGLVPVHWAGQIAPMRDLLRLAGEHNLVVVEDACHAILAHDDRGQKAGTFGDVGAFSMHPLKNLNVWGDGGFLVTNRSDLYEKLVRLRNHGLINRNECAIYGYNSRLDTLQAIVANHLLDKLEGITAGRIANAERYDRGLAGLSQVTIPPRRPGYRHVYHLYSLQVEQREALQEHLQSRGIDAKVHYPIPMHLQPAAAELGYRRGDFPRAEALCDSVLSLPVHEFITSEQVDTVIAAVREFYAG